MKGKRDDDDSEDQLDDDPTYIDMKELRKKQKNANNPAFNQVIKIKKPKKEKTAEQIA